MFDMEGYIPPERAYYCRKCGKQICLMEAFRNGTLCNRCALIVEAEKRAARRKNWIARHTR